MPNSRLPIPVLATEPAAFVPPPDAPARAATHAPHQELSGVNLYSRYAVAGGFCCQATHTLLVPMDVVKTRLQTSPGEFNGAMHATRAIVQQSGYRALLLGITPTFVGYSLQGAGKFGFNEMIKDAVMARMDPTDRTKYRLPLYIACSSVAEVIGSVMLCPWEAARIRMVSGGDVSATTLGVFRGILAGEGVHGLFKGLGPLLAKQVPYTATQLTVFSLALDAFYERLLPAIRPGNSSKNSLSMSQQLTVSAGAGCIAGVASAIVSHPADTILSRINMKAENGDVRGANRSVASVLKEIGYRGVWCGLGTRCVMVGTLSTGMFLIYDTVKLACGLATSGH